MQKRVNIEEIRDFYNETPEIWASYDHWHLWSHQQIQNFIDQVDFSNCNFLLNAGSGGNSYGVKPSKMIHIDIAEEKIKGIQDAFVGNIEKLPFEDKKFDGLICVGSVINYCDALAVISEFSRVLKQGAKLVLEFENSDGYEYRKTNNYQQSATVVTVKFQGKDHTQWLYSISYIKSLLHKYGFHIEKSLPFHIISSFILSFSKNETTSTRYAKLDYLIRKIPFFSKHANNIIFLCRKL